MTTNSVSKPLKIYFDTCVWCRLFELSERVEMEANAVLEILAKADRGEVEIVGSTAILAEIDLISSEEKRQAVRGLVEKSCRIVWVREEDFRLVEEIVRLCRASAMDSLHIAVASRCADVFMTVDDALLRKKGCLKRYIEVRNPVDVYDKERGSYD